MIVKVTHDERRLLSRMRDDDHEAFEAIYHRYKKPLASAIYRMLRSPELVDDILQELFVRLWENRNTIDPGKPVHAYLYRIAQHLVYDIFRRLAQEEKLQAQLINHLSVEEADPILEEANYALVHQAIAHLPPKRREVFILCKLEAKSYEEVGALLNISLSTINDHIYKANKFLRHYLTTSMSSALLTMIHIELLSV